VVVDKIYTNLFIDKKTVPFF